MIRLRITSDGRIRGLWTDEVRLGDIGVLRVQRASHVEFDERLQCWCVGGARDPGRVLHHSDSRTAALAWERDYFGPGGSGWHEPRPPTTLSRPSSTPDDCDSTPYTLAKNAFGEPAKR